MSSLPSGTVTFLFTDVEGSTRLLQELGDAYGEVVRDHRRLLREHFGRAGGEEVDTQGDAFFFSFPRARDAVAGAVAAQRALSKHSWPEGAQVKVRMAIHTGEPSVGDEGYLGMDVVRAARICAAGHGGQILLSETTRALVGNELPPGVSVHDLGETNLKDVQHERIYQLSLDGQASAFPPLKAERPHGPTADFARRADDLAEQAQNAIAEHVMQEIQRSLESGKPPRAAFSGLLILLATVLTLLVILVLIVAAIRVAF